MSAKDNLHSGRTMAERWPLKSEARKAVEIVPANYSPLIAKVGATGVSTIVETTKDDSIEQSGCPPSQINLAYRGTNRSEHGGRLASGLFRSVSESLENINNFLGFYFSIPLTNICVASAPPGVEMNSHEAPVPLVNALALCPIRLHLS